jgi:hypothetical protein
MGRGWGGQGLARGPFGHGFAGHGPMAAAAGPIMALIVIALVVGVVIAFWQIFKKAGYPGAYGLLMLVPFVNVAALAFLAASEWPVIRDLRAWGAWHQAQEGAVAEPAPVAAPAQGVQVAEADPMATTEPIPAAADTEKHSTASDDADVIADPPSDSPKE